MRYGRIFLVFFLQFNSVFVHFWEFRLLDVSIYVSIYKSIYVSINLTISTPSRRADNLSNYPCIHLCMYLFMYIVFIYLSIYVFNYYPNPCTRFYLSPPPPHFYLYSISKLFKINNVCSVNFEQHALIDRWIEGVHCSSWILLMTLRRQKKNCCSNGSTWHPKNKFLM